MVSFGSSLLDLRWRCRWSLLQKDRSQHTHRISFLVLRWRLRCDDLENISLQLEHVTDLHTFRWCLASSKALRNSFLHLLHLCSMFTKFRYPSTRLMAPTLQWYCNPDCIFLNLHQTSEDLPFMWYLVLELLIYYIIPYITSHIIWVKVPLCSKIDFFVL